MIQPSQKQNFETLKEAMSNGDCCLLEAFDLKTERQVYLICAMNRAGETNELIPLAELVNENPYERYVPPMDVKKLEAE